MGDSNQDAATLFRRLRLILDDDEPDKLDRVRGVVESGVELTPLSPAESAALDRLLRELSRDDIEITLDEIPHRSGGRRF
jgi:hypothetical protein